MSKLPCNLPDDVWENIWLRVHTGTSQCRPQSSSLLRMKTLTMRCGIAMGSRWMVNVARMTCRPFQAKSGRSRPKKSMDNPLRKARCRSTDLAAVLMEITVPGSSLSVPNRLRPCDRMEYVL